jgi:hypothetical protein
MATRVWLVRAQPWEFRPQAQYDYDQLAGITVGSSVNADIFSQRSGKQHRFYWGMVRKVWEHQERYETADDIDTLFRWRTGHVREIVTRKGDTIIRPVSIAFDKMEQPAFHAYVQKVQGVIVDEILPKVQSDKLTREIMDYIGLPYRG